MRASLGKRKVRAVGAASVTAAVAATALLSAGPVRAEQHPGVVSADHPTNRGRGAHVLLLSIDGLHATDVAAYVSTHPRSALASLGRNGLTYSAAQTTFPSDSFPGMIAQLTGAGPGTAGIYYDDTYSHTLMAPGTVDCSTARPGAEVAWTEGADRSQNPITLDAGQGLKDSALTNLGSQSKAQTLANAPAIRAAILRMTATPQTLLDPAALPLDPRSCVPVYPHNYLRVNTVFEVARSRGLGTAWSDKHPAYEILNGPSGAGVQDLFTPEINSVADNAGDDWSTDNALTQLYDSTKVGAVVNEIKGYDHSGQRHLGTPAIFGMNFQSVSTAQKLPTSEGLAGGYLPNGKPGPLLSRALDFVDTQLGSMRTAIHRAGLDSSTTIILSAKHGQAPTDPATLRRVDDGAIIAGLDAAWAQGHPGAPPLVAFSVDDDGMLLWLADRRPAALRFATRYLMTHAAPANTITDPKGVYSIRVASSGLTGALTGDRAAALFGAAAGDTRTPDLVGLAQPGVVYTGNVKKIAEHGGDAPADLNVALIVAGPTVHRHGTIKQAVRTTQIAPTILTLLGLNPHELQSTQTDHTYPLPGS